MIRWIVNLYPRAWRNRYESEFLALLEARPPRLLDGVDTVRGAFDAHLHPDLADRDRSPMPWTHRIPGLLVLSGALALLSGIIAIAASLDTPWDSWSLLPTGLMLLLLSLPGDYLAVYRRQVAAVLGLTVICVVAGNAAPEPLSVAFAVVGTIVAYSGLLVATSIRAGLPTPSRWIVLAIAIGIPLAPMIAAALALVDLGAGQPWHLLASLPFGLVSAVLGMRMTLNGSPTIIDPSVELEAAAR